MQGTPIDAIQATPLRVLILGTAQTEAELLAAALRRAGFAPRWQRVETEPDLLAALEAAPDLVLADFATPGLPAQRALGLLRARERPLPLIVIASPEEEEEAVGLLWEGAADVLLRGRTARLGAAVLRALAADAPAGRAAQSHALLAAIVQSSQDAILSRDPEGRILSWNPGAERLYGYGAAEVLGQPFDMLVPEEARERVRRVVKEAMLDRRQVTLETRHRHRDGHQIAVLVNRSPMLDAQGRMLGTAIIVRDISERERAEATLRASEARFRATFEQAAVGIAHVAPDGRWLRVNERLCQIVGHTREELLRRTFQDITHPDDLDADVEQVRRVLAGEITTYGMDKRYLRQDGRVVWVRLTVALVRTADGAPDYFISVVEDISTRKAAEEALALQAALIDRAHDALIVRDPQGRIIRWNAGAAALYGWTAAEAEGRVSHDLLRTRVLDPVTGEPRGSGAESDATLATAGIWEGELEHTRRDGRVLVVESRQVLLRAAAGAGRAGHPLAILEINRDLTAHKAAGAERNRLLASERVARAVAEATVARLSRLQALAGALAGALTGEQVAATMVTHSMPALGATGAIVAMVARDGAALQALSLAGYPQQVAARWRTIPLDMASSITDAARSGRVVVCASAEEAAARYPHLAEEQAELGLGALAAHPLLVGGRAIGALLLIFPRARRFEAEDLIFLDTLANLCAPALERARLYDAERAARAAAEEAVRARDAFLSDAAHELKTPLTSLIGYSELLLKLAARDTLDDERSRRALQIIRLQAERLHQLVVHLLDVTRLETGRLLLQPVPADLTRLAGEMVLAARIRSTAHTLSVEAPGPVWAEMDVLRIEQVLTDLLDNAIKFSPGGGPIVVSVSLPDPATVCLAVRDHGLGVPPEHRLRIFERLVQAHAESYRSGLGLGLYISRQIVELHGGRLEASFPEDGGSLFSVFLPRQAAPAPS